MEAWLNDHRIALEDSEWEKNTYFQVIIPLSSTSWIGVAGNSGNHPFFYH
jgi:hypothetical protein